MKRLVTGVVLAAVCLTCSGCLAVATVAAVGALVVSNTKPAGRTAGTSAVTPSRPAVLAAPASTPAEPAVVKAEPVSSKGEASAGWSRPGMVVVVDGDSGTATNLTWQEGMKLAAATATGKSGSFSTAKIFRGTRVLPADLRQDWTVDLALFSGDVVELRH